MGFFDYHLGNEVNAAVGMDRKYVAIDLKSFYASVECVERGLDRRYDLQIDYIVAKPRMALCLDYCTRIYYVWLGIFANFVIGLSKINVLKELFYE